MEIIDVDIRAPRKILIVGAVSLLTGRAHFTRQNEMLDV